MRRTRERWVPMKRKLACLLILALMAALPAALAEEALTAEDQAYAIVNIINDYLVRSGKREEPLYLYAEPLDDLGLSFISENGEVALICMFDEAREKLWSSLLITSEPVCVRDVLYSGCTMMLLQGDEAGTKKVSELFDTWYPDVITAMDADEFYSQTCYDCEGFDVELMVTPLEEGSRLNLIFYWKN